MNFYEKENISLYLDNLKLLESMVTLKQKIEISINTSNNIMRPRLHCIKADGALLQSC